GLTSLHQQGELCFLENGNQGRKLHPPTGHSTKRLHVAVEVAFTALARYKGYMGGGRAQNDEVLMLAYAEGDQDAFEELFGRYAARLFNFLLRACGNRAVAEDLFQVTFLRLHQARRNYVAGTFKAFLFAIALNLLRDERSRAEHKRR